MPPRASHRLDLLVVPSQEQGESSIIDTWWTALQNAAVITSEGQPASMADACVDGGFLRARLDRPGRPVVYANALGGFRATCPGCSANLVPMLGKALETYRKEGVASARCARCDVDWSINQLSYAPPVAFGAAALEFADCGSASLSPWGESLLRATWQAFRVVARRVGVS